MSAKHTREIRPCIRCGIMRPAKKQTVMCRDCRAVMSREEKFLWAGMTALRLLCFFGIHPRRGYQFVGDSWNDIWIRVCVECGRQMFDRGGVHDPSP